jgi:hypothetical protein
MRPGTPADVANGTRFVPKTQRCTADAGSGSENGNGNSKSKDKSNPTIDYHSTPCGWYMHVYPKIREALTKPGVDNYGLMEFIQYPGETIFVPGNWWHAVLNLDDTLAITQNYCSTSNFDAVWRESRTNRKHMAKRWLSALQISEPVLAKAAIEMNQKDNFTFQFSKQAIRKAAKRKLDKERKLQHNENDSGNITSAKTKQTANASLISTSSISSTNAFMNEMEIDQMMDRESRRKRKMALDASLDAVEWCEESSSGYDSSTGSDEDSDSSSSSSSDSS